MQLERGKRVGRVGAAVVRSEEGQGVVVPPLGHEPAGAFRDEPGQPYGEEGGEHLDEGDAAPGPVRLDGQGAEGDPRCDQGAEVVQRVEQGGELGTVGGVGELGDEQRGGSIFEAQAQPDDGARGGEHGDAGGEGLQEDAEEDDHGADDDGVLAPYGVHEPPEEELAHDSAEPLRAVEDAQLRAPSGSRSRLARRGASARRS